MTRKVIQLVLGVCLDYMKRLRLDDKDIIYVHYGCKTWRLGICIYKARGICITSMQTVLLYYKQLPM